MSLQVESSAGQTVPEGGGAVVGRVRLRSDAPLAPLRAQLVLRTNLSDYALPLLLYSGRLDIVRGHRPYYEDDSFEMPTTHVTRPTLAD